MGKCSFGLFIINLQYLDADKMRSKVENLCLKYLETDKMEAEVVKSELDTLKGPLPIVQSLLQIQNPDF